jgi:hypothetical protein
VSPLLPEMIELENLRINQAAAGTRMPSEVLVKEFPAALTALPARRVGLVPVQLTPLLEIRAVAAAAPPLVALRMTIESAQWLASAAPSAAADPQLELKPD